MDWRQTEWNHMQEKQKEAMNLMYQNTKDSHAERTDRNTLILDVKNSAHSTKPLNSATNHNFSVELHGPLEIDKLSDIYLDSFLTFRAHKNNGSSFDDSGDNLDAGASVSDANAFLLHINEFKLNSNSNTSNIYNKIIIPNSATADDGAVVLHKSKKFNYICSINPCTLHKITGKITLLNGATRAFDFNSARFIAEFSIIARK
tara:strand:- start:2103 stop:2711 length:609 start_codon:yes stop_codon:yes gene_type:complete